MKIKKAVLEDAKRKRDTEERRSHYLFLLSSLSRRPSSAMKELKTYFSMDPRLMHPMIYIFIFYLIFFFPFCGGEGSYVPVCVHTAEKKHIKKLLVYRQQKKCVSSWDFCATFVQEVYKKPRQ